MPDTGQNPPPPESATAAAETPQTALDAAMQQIEAFIANLEKQHQQAEELARVPDDIPRFVTRYGP